jgi:hypothetical protein
MKTILCTLIMALVVSLSVPHSARAQTGELLESIRQGGGWVEIPISNGRGGFSSEALPTLGLTLRGCLNVWWGHTGEWRFEAHDPVNDERLNLTATPGEGVPFAYRTGMRSSVDVRVRWSEPGDTTLVLWVGLDGMSPGRRDACTPVYGVTGDREPDSS